MHPGAAPIAPRDEPSTASARPRGRPHRLVDLLALVSLAALMAHFMVALVRVSRTPGGPVAYDIYTYFYPTMMIAARSVWAGGKGFLWNPLHACGQPFFGSGTTGILYPPAILSLFLTPDHAFYGLLFFNLTVGAIGAYYLCREFGTRVPAAWCGALAFALSNSATDVITSTPLVSGPYAWLPAAMLFCERLLREATVRRAVGLAVMIAFALIPGHPQAVFYLYQLIALRTLWEFLTRRPAFPVRTLGMLALALALPPLLVAVQLLPTLEVMRAGIRNADLSLREISVGFLSWQGLRQHTAWRWDIDNPFLLMPWVLAGLSFADSARRRLVVFYATMVALTLILALGPNGFLFPLYMQLPFGTLFRDPSRFLWITSFCISILASFGVDTVLAATEKGWAARLVVVVLLLAAATGYYFLVLGFYQRDWTVVEIAAGGVLVAALLPRLRAVAAAALIAALLMDLVVNRPPPFRHLLPDSTALFERAPLLVVLRQRMTPQDRVYLAPRHADYTLEQKTLSLMRVPVLYDYEPQPTRRWASYFHMMRTGLRMTKLTEWGFIFGGWFPPGFRRRLLDLVGARFVIAAAEEDHVAGMRGPPLRVLPWLPGDVRVYENREALPRAAWIPHVEVVPDPVALLGRLAGGDDDLRRVALIEAPPPGPQDDGAGPGDGRVEFETNDPEHLVLHVDSTRPGFLFLADQYFPGWHATVNGAAVPIVRANYAFRLIAVPAGDSVVEFRFLPASVALGGLVSGVSILGVVALLVASRRRG